MREKPSKSHNPLRRHAGVALAAVVLFAGMCAGASAQPVPVAVYVVPATTTPLPPGTCTTQANYIICVNPDPVRTPAVSDGTPVSIVWTLQGQGWTFDKTKGIDIKNSRWKSKQDTPTQYTGTSKKKKGELSKYDVNVTDGTTPLKFDPTIMN